MTDTIWLLRHGYRLNWVSTNWKSETGLPRDPPLAAFGVTQAEETAAYFAALPEDERPTAILSSPYYRCLQTATPIARALNLPICVEHGLAEWYSPVAPGTGLHPRPGPSSSLQPYFPSVTLDPTWAPLYYPPRTGENVPAIHARATTALPLILNAVRERLGEQRARRLLLVSHAATVIVYARALVGRELQLRVGCCTLTKVVRSSNQKQQEEGAGWKAVLLADGGHMKGGSTRDWGMEDIEVENGRVVEDAGVPGTEGEVDEVSGPQVQMNSNL